MAMKGCSAFPKAPASLEPHHQIVLCHISRTLVEGRESYTSAEMQLVYSTAPADRANNILICACLQRVYHVPQAVQAVVSSVIISGAQSCCALLHSTCYLKATHMNGQCSLIQEGMLHKFYLGHNTVEATKNIFCVKSESTVDHITVTRWIKKFCLDFKNLNDQAR